jgi:hypothetical protein
MGLSETIIAASIGAAATVSAAMFQLVSALRANKSRLDPRPKKGNTTRSLLAVLALMAVSAVGGYFFSEFRTERTANDMKSMRDELNAKLQILAATTERLATSRGGVSEGASTQPANSAVLGPGSVEAVVYAPACQAVGQTGSCSEANSQKMALCGAIPGDMQARKFDLYIKGANSDATAKAEFDQDLGGAKFLGPPAEYPQGENRKAVCVNFLHWSDKPHIATIVVEYGNTVDAAPATAQSASAVAATLAPSGAQVSLTATAAVK